VRLPPRRGRDAVSGVLRRLEQRHLEEAVRYRAVSFGSSTDDAAHQHIAATVDRGHLWGWVDGGELRAVTRLERVDHWFGGALVPCQQVAGVAVPPEHRGRGVASAAMAAAVRQGADQGLGISLLFPAVTALYRRLGWEQAGGLVRHRLEARHAPAAGEPLRRATPADRPAIRACYRTMCATLNGPADRPGWGWDQLDEVPHTYVLDGPDGLEAYLRYEVTRTPDDWQYGLGVRDWAATTLRGHTALLGFVGRHGTVGRAIQLHGPWPHPWAFLLPEQDLRRDWSMAWMARGLDLGVAVAARGFPPEVAAAVGISVDDPVLPGARGPWRLEVDGGQGTLTPVDAAAVTLSARAVGPLFTGWVSAEDLARAGLLSGPPRDLATLTAAFAGPSPVQLEFF